MWDTKAAGQRAGHGGRFWCVRKHRKQNETIQEGAKFFGDSFAEKVMTQLHSAGKIECIKKASGLGYLCTAEVDATTLLAVRKK